MKIKKTSLAIVALIVCVSLLSTAFAMLYMSRNVNFTATIATNGNFKIYSDALCTQEFTTQDWTSIDVSSIDFVYKQTVYLKNLGNAPLKLSWQMSQLNGWIPNTSPRYIRNSGNMQFFSFLHASTDGGRWIPMDCTYPVEIGNMEYFVNLPVGEVYEMRYGLTVLQNSPPETFAWQIVINGESV